MLRKAQAGRSAEMGGFSKLTIYNSGWGGRVALFRKGRVVVVAGGRIRTVVGRCVGFSIVF